jgi:hypothetical protein
MRKLLLFAAVFVLSLPALGQHIDRVDSIDKVLPSTPPAGAYLSYFGGPVISNVQVVVVFWGTNVFPDVTAGIGSFYQNITNSSYYDMLSEYATNISSVNSGPGTNQFIGRGAFGGAFTITPSICDTAPCTVTDAQVQAELLAQVTASQISPPMLDMNGYLNTIYMIYFPPGVTISLEGLTSCNQFCGYHGTTANTFNSQNLAYGVMPDFSPPDGCRQGCGSGTNFQNLTAVSSHELAEIVTDIDAPGVRSTAFPTAWLDPSFGTGEIGDICGHQDSIVSTPGGDIFVQQLWSNRLNACVALGTITMLIPFPTSITYSPRALGTSSLIRPVKLKNTTGVGIYVSSITITGPNADDFRVSTTTCSSLAVNKSCTISTLFTPTAVGKRTASLVITDSAGNSPQTVPLLGTGR